MKKKVFYFLAGLALITGLAACSDDEETKLLPPAASIEFMKEGSAEMVQGDTLYLKAKVERKLEETQYDWLLNGQSVSTDSTYSFIPEEPGTYTIRVKVSNLAGNTMAEASVQVSGKYKNGVFILNEGSVWGGDKGGHLLFISPKGEMTDTVFRKENNGAWLGNCPQDLFITNNKMYIVAQNGGNEGGFLTILNAETMKKEAAFGDDLKGVIDWPTHVAVLNEDDIYLRDNGGIRVFHPSTKEATFIKGSNGARKNTMAVVEGKLFAAQKKSLLVIEAGKDTISYKVDFDSNVSGVVKTSDNNLWISTSGKISKVNAKDYSIMATNELPADAAKKLTASFAATPSITAKGDTLYMSALSTKIYRHIFSKNQTDLMVDAKDLVENANIVYNTVAVHPVTGEVYMNTIKGYGESEINQITVFDFSGNEPVVKAAYHNYTKFPAGIFFTSYF